MTDELVAVGRVVKPHGIRGEVSLVVLTENPEERFAPGSVLRLDDGRTLTVASSRIHHERRLVAFEEIPNRSAAEELRGCVLHVRESELPPLPEGSYWPHQLIGCEVVTESGTRLGEIVEILATPANDVWIARSGKRDVLIPAIADVIIQVDVAASRVTVRQLAEAEE